MNKYQFKTEERSLMECSRMPFAVYQFLDGRVVTLILSAGFCKLFGYDDPKEAYFDMDHNMYRDTHPDDAARIAEAALHFATQGGSYEVIYRSKSRNDECYHIIHAKGEHMLTPTGERLAHIWYTDEGTYSEGVSSQETELNEALNKALHMESLLKANYYDYLTGLPSMTRFFELAESGSEQIAQNGGQPVILYLDLSGMKFYNRKHGFAKGDQLLRSFASLLIRYFSNENCSRLGQDHFAVYTDCCGLDDTLHRLFHDWDHIYEEETLPVRVGVCFYPPGSMDISTACDRAKIACDARSKTYASVISYFHENMLADAEKRQYIISNIDKAIEERWIEVYYQPIVRSANGRVCEEEALSRWIDPVNGFLSPADFIPALEDARLVYKLDLYVVEQILEKNKILQEAGLHIVPQSVNLSRTDFDTCDIVEEICKRIDASGFNRNMLTIEITESVIGGDFDFMKEQILRFQELGFPVWMDDFGSGYSSLDVLQSIPFDLIKFDMRFMQQFHENDKCKIILTELMKMAIGLGISTVCEGVEDQDQVEFLREIGCAKLQGYYYEKPIPMQEILNRYEKGIQIGFENPEESAYFDSIGQINLYDLAVISSDYESDLSHYFNTLPMAIIEIWEDQIRFVRTNQSYRDFMRRTMKDPMPLKETEFSPAPNDTRPYFMKMIRQCCESGNRVIIDEAVENGAAIHSLIRRIAVNEITGTVALVIAVLAITDGREEATYANIARALAADYFNLFYVDLTTERFIEYSSRVGQETLAVERHGENFFEASQTDARRLLYIEDQERFVKAFTKENVVNHLDSQGTFTITYRLIQSDGEPVYVSMKAMRMMNDHNRIIIGVSSADTQMRQKQEIEQYQLEKAAYARITALSGSYICTYTVDPDTEHYIEYDASTEFERFGIAKEGEDFFLQAQLNGTAAVYEEDLPLYKREFTKDNVLQKVRENGLFFLRYRLMIGGKPVPVTLRAAMIEEDAESKLIIGIHKRNVELQEKP